MRHASGWMVVACLCIGLASACDGGSSSGTGGSGGGTGGATGGTGGSGGACLPGQDVCDERCVDLSSDPANCGVCGRDCHGQSCEGAMCGVIYLAVGQRAPGALAVDGRGVYWTDVSVLLQLRFDDAQPSPLVMPLVKPGDITADGTHVYWIGTIDQTRGLHRSSAGDMNEVLVDADAMAKSVAVDQDPAGQGYVYWTSADGQVKRLDKLLEGGKISLAFDQLDPMGVALDEGHVYWASRGDSEIGGGWIARVPKDPAMGAVPEELAADPNGPLRIAIGEHVYWTNAAGQLLYHAKVPDESPVGEVLAEGGVSDVAVDGEHVYWTDAASGAVFRWSFAEGVITTLAKGQHAPWRIAVDANWVYWINRGISGEKFSEGEVVVVAK
jgi:hypothetical protein